MTDAYVIDFITIHVKMDLLDCHQLTILSLVQSILSKPRLYTLQIANKWLYIERRSVSENFIVDNVHCIVLSLMRNMRKRLL